MFVQRMDAAVIRKQLRTERLKARAGLTAEERAVLSSTIQKKLFDYILQKKFTSVHIYLSYRDEVDTHSVVSELLGTGVAIIVPIVEQQEEQDVLLHTLHSAEIELKPGRFGIPEPSVRVDVDLSNIQAVILPLAAFDRQGTRLGYGKGFYDRFLAGFSRTVTKIGLAFAMQEVPFIPAMEHDVPLDLVITEQEIIRMK